MKTTSPRSGTSAGLVIAVVAAFSFGMSGAFIKPLLEAGWSPAAAVTVRALVGGIVLTPAAVILLRGRWASLWRAKWRVLLMALIGVAGTQLAYFSAIEHIPVSTAILLEYMAPVLLVGLTWVTTRKVPQVVVIVGTVVAVAGLVLVVGPAAGGHLDPIGLVFGVIAMVGCAIYYVVAADSSGDLPPVALAAAGLVLGGIALGVVGLTGLVPFTVSTAPTVLFGSTVAWWIPMLIVGVVATAVAYSTNITASEMLGSRLASFTGLLEVVAATLYAWILLGEDLSFAQLVGGALILGGIAFVRSAREPADALLPIGPTAPAIDPTPTAPLTRV
ncbi:membrane protein [Frondihabitans sucicola]|uniref:Membrane protein n=1 Tax=Frondihabitans sucicola TaxID=1268041 RepID=A0ABM8GPB5_9MICO|nr:DMT family transporter [Frondihabitans sucicola]BDZ50295.1 membrane protein [Frondihabitans sucicola]